MGEIKKPVAVKLIMSVISKEEIFFEKVRDRLSQKFGPLDFESPFLPFYYTSYYEKEMGKNLKRKIISFQKLIPPDLLPEIKIFTNQLEKEFLYPQSNNRRLNLDPGYISLSKLVLASTKNYTHRIYIGRGIYAEVTLRYKKKEGFKSWEWTYPDYRSSVYLKIFNHLREIYREQIKGSS